MNVLFFCDISQERCGRGAIAVVLSLKGTHVLYLSLRRSISGPQTREWGSLGFLTPIWGYECDERHVLTVCICVWYSFLTRTILFMLL